LPSTEFTFAVKTLGTILLVNASLLTVCAAEDTRPARVTNVVVISTDYIDHLVAEARTNNPSLLAAHSRADAAAANVDSVRVWEDPTFMAGANIFSARGFKASENGDLVYGLQEKLPMWGLPKLNREVASAGMAARREEAGFHFQQLRRDIIKTLVSAALAGQVVNIGEQDLVWLDATSKAAEAKYREGQADVADTLQIQNAVALRTDQLRTDRLELVHEHFILNRLLNRDHGSPWPPLQLPPVAPPVPYSEKLLALALANEPNLKVLEQMAKQAEATAQRTERTRLPDVSLGIQGYQYSGDGGFREGVFTLNISLPWVNAGKYHNDHEREKQNARAAQQERDDQRLTVREEVHHITVDLDAQRRQALLYDNEISIRARQALADKLAVWETGRATLREVLEARRDALDAQLMIARATAAQDQTLAELLLWTGLESFESLAPLAAEPAIADHAEATEK